MLFGSHSVKSEQCRETSIFVRDVVIDISVVWFVLVLKGTKKVHLIEIQCTFFALYPVCTVFLCFEPFTRVLFCPGV